MTIETGAVPCSDVDASPLDTVDSPSALEPCIGVYGDFRIVETEPGISEIARAVYIPLAGPIDQPLWGIYDADGRIVEEAAYKRGPGRVLVGQLDHAELPSDVDIIHEEMIYGGAMHAHYGHFLAAMLPRYWIDFAAHPERKVLVHSWFDLDVLFSIDFIREIFGALGLDRARFVRLERPSVINRLIVPEALFQELSAANPLIARLCERINTRFNLPTSRTRRAAYFSKEKLVKGVWQVENEKTIAAVLAAEGVDIVYPERMPLREQMILFERYETICGLVSSAFHTSLFARARNRIVGLNHNTFVYTNHTMIDRIKGNEATYVYPSAGMRNLGPTDAFSCVFECPNPAKVAKELLTML